MTDIRRAGTTATGLVGAVLLLLPLAGLAACGQQTPTAADQQPAESSSGTTSGTSSGTSTSPPPVVRLTEGEAEPDFACAGEASGMSLDYAVGAKGAATPGAAVGRRQRLHDGERLVIAHDGRSAWVVASDGVAHTRMGLRRQHGWLVDQIDACSR